MAALMASWHQPLDQVDRDLFLGASPPPLSTLPSLAGPLGWLSARIAAGLQPYELRNGKRGRHANLRGATRSKSEGGALRGGEDSGGFTARSGCSGLSAHSGSASPGSVGRYPFPKLQRGP